MFWRRKKERELDRELRSHLEQEAEESGLPAREALYAAQRTLAGC